MKNSWSFLGAWSLVLGASALAADADDPFTELASFQVADGFGGISGLPGP